MGRGAKVAGIVIAIVSLILVIILPIYFTKIQCKNGFGYKCDSPPAESPSTATAPQTMSPTAGPSVATAPQTASPPAGSGLGAPAPAPTDCYGAGPAGRDMPCCPGLNYNDNECY